MAKSKKQYNEQRKKRREQQAHVFDPTETGPGTGKNMVDMDFELQAAQNAAGQKENTYGLWGPIWKFLVWYDSKRVPHRFKKKTYMWLMLFTGFFGGHRWYQGRKWLALFETLFFWTGVPCFLLVTDFMEVFPIKADEDGYITMK